MNMDDRPGTIRESFAVSCDICIARTNRSTYQEASIWLTTHLEKEHPEWRNTNPVVRYMLSREKVIADSSLGPLKADFKRTVGREPAS